jgi:hypothetical protein
VEFGPRRYPVVLPYWIELYESIICFLNSFCETACAAPSSLVTTMPRFVKLSTSSILSPLRVKGSVLIVFTDSEVNSKFYPSNTQDPFSLGKSDEASRSPVQLIIY